MRDFERCNHIPSSNAPQHSPFLRAAEAGVLIRIQSRRFMLFRAWLSAELLAHEDAVVSGLGAASGSGKGGIDRAEALEGKFAVDSPVEGTGFEPSVPLGDCHRSEPLVRK